MTESMDEIIAKQKEQCIFCKIIAGEIPTIKVYEDELVLAIMDINPAADGHMLLMPKEHYPLMPWIPRGTFKHLFKISKYLSRALEEAFSVKSTIFVANGGVAGQQSSHFMMHVLPTLSNLKAKGDNSNVDDGVLNKLKPVISQNLNAAIQKVAEQDTEAEQFIEVQEVQKNTIEQLFQTNSEFKDLILNNPEKLKAKIAEDENFQRIFKGIDIDALSEKLREMNGRR